MVEEDTFLIAGSVPHVYSQQLSEMLGMPLIHAEVTHFPDGESRVCVHDIPSSCKRAVVLQSLAERPNDYLIETFLLVDALRHRGIPLVTLVCPYLAYARQDGMKIEDASVASRLFARFFKEVGVERLVVMDLHAAHVPAFYDFPVEHVTARQLMVQEIKKRKLHREPFVVVGPDLGASKLVALYAEELQSSFAIIEKRRLDAQLVESLSVVGKVEEKNVLLADDMCSTAHTLVSAAKACREKGAKKIVACVTHGLFSDGAVARIEESPIDLLLVSDTVMPSEAVTKSKKICVVPVVSAFAAVLRSNDLKDCLSTS